MGGGQRPGEGVGNGKAICARFAEEGASVFIVARHIESAKRTLSFIDERHRERCAVFEGDVSKEDDVKNAFRACFERYGRIDALVNNVGVFDGDAAFMDFDMEHFDKAMEITANGAIYCFRHIYSYMKDRGGSVVQISSIGGSMIGKHGRFSYAASKHMMTYLGQNAAATFAGAGIRVNTILLGYVTTPLVIEPMVEAGKTREEAIAARNRLVPLKGGCGDAWDTANAALFLVSDEAKFITGANLPVDGGSLVCGGRC
ncbi:MAG: SDR family oxidoreductase [Clostridia bacterium]|nr:SDR family oxidoreductase [Clostridia bacterium]